MIIDPVQVAPGWITQTSTVAVNIASAVVLCPSNLRRVAVAFIPASANIRVLPAGNATATVGFQLTTSVSSGYFYRDWGGMIGERWTGIGVGGMTNVTVIEVIWTPDRVRGLSRLLGK